MIVRPASGANKFHAFQKPMHLPHPWLLHGRRAGDCDGGGSAHRLGRQPVRHPGGAPVDRLCAALGEAADRPGRAGPCAHDPLHGETDRRGGGGTDRPDQPDDHRGRAERRGAGYRAHHRRQRAAVGRGIEADDQRDAEGREPARHGCDQARSARPASTAPTTRKAAPRSWRSGRRGLSGGRAPSLRSS